MRKDDLYQLPKGINAPQDDGAADHLKGLRLPTLSLVTTLGQSLELGEPGSGWQVLFCYPRTGRPDQEALGGTEAWNAIPGARGCTPQSCGYRDSFAELRELGVEVFGVSTQPQENQREAITRLRLPFDLISDESLALARALALPTFEVEGVTLLKRLTLILRAGIVQACFYPVFPPNADASLVVDWIRLRR